jgi:hypothetical protein
MFNSCTSILSFNLNLNGMTANEKANQVFQEHTKYPTHNLDHLLRVHSTYEANYGPKAPVNDHFQRLAWDARKRFVGDLRCDECKHIHSAPEANKKWSELKVMLDKTALKGN